MLRRVLLAAPLALLCPLAWAFINPSFSPVQLVQQSEMVLALKFEANAKDGKVTATVVKAFKGDKPAKPVVLDLGASAYPEQGKLIAEIIAQGSKEALFFVGQFEEGEGGAPAAGPKAMMHLRNKWFVFNGNEDGSWDFEKMNERMQGTWAGTTDMLQRAVDYVLADPDADVPVKAGCEWDTPVKFANIPGQVSAAVAVEYDGKLALRVVSDKTERLFAWADGKMTEVLTKDFPSFAKPPLPVELAKVADAGAAGPVFYADFDGDGLPDILQTFEKGSYFYKGAGPDKFAEPVKCPVFLGKGKSTAFLGDYDADGLLDIFTSAEDGNHLWQNVGGGKFVNRLFAPLELTMSGEIDYISKPGGVAGCTCDVNNDGRQDIFIAYAEIAPQVFFDRGFRSFGHAHEMDFGEMKLVDEAAKGQQAGVVADFTGDGAEDMVIILRNGDAWLLPRKVIGKALSVSVSLGKDAPSPLLVTGYAGKRCLGAWNVAAGGAPAFFGLADAGTLTIKWKLRDGSEKSANVNVIDRPVKYVIGQ